MVNLSEAETYGQGVVSIESNAEIVINPRNTVDKMFIPAVKAQLGIGLLDRLDFKVNINSYYYYNIGLKAHLIDEKDYDFGVGVRIQSNIIGHEIGYKAINPAIDLHYTLNDTKSKLLINPTLSYVKIKQDEERKVFANLSLGILRQVDDHTKLKYGLSAGTFLDKSPAFTFGFSATCEFRLFNKKRKKRKKHRPKTNKF